MRKSINKAFASFQSKKVLKLVKIEFVLAIVKHNNHLKGFLAMLKG